MEFMVEEELKKLEAADRTKNGQSAAQKSRPSKNSSTKMQRDRILKWDILLEFRNLFI